MKPMLLAVETHCITLTQLDLDLESRSMNHNNTKINKNELQIGFIAELQLRHTTDLHILRKNSFWLQFFLF